MGIAFSDPEVAMANKNLFARLFGRRVPAADARNAVQAPAYSLSPRHELAQLANTGFLARTFYADDADQLDAVLRLANDVDATFLAKTAIYARRMGRMKDMPALLASILASKDGVLLERVFDRVIDDSRMLRNFVQILRSGRTGRSSLGSRPKRLVRRWLDARDGDSLVRAALGNEPSLADILRMVHPKPTDAARAALYGWILDREHDAALLPPSARALEAFRAGTTNVVPDVPMQYLASDALDHAAWTAIAMHAPWQSLRMHLNTFLRHGVFDDTDVTNALAAKLRDPRSVRAARVLPYQVLAAYKHAHPRLPRVLVDALHDALEIATENAPVVSGSLAVAVDVSGSMRSPVTGARGSASSKVTCIEVAALVAAVLMRKNRGAEILPFSDDVIAARLEPRDSVLTNAEKLWSLPSGGTNVSAPLRLLNDCGLAPDLVVVVSDNQSWVDAKRANHGGTETMNQWERLRRKNAGARLVLLDLTPSRTTQALERSDVLNVGGFSDAVFDVIADFARDPHDAARFVERIEAIAL